MTPQDWPPLTTLGLAVLALRGAFAFWRDMKRGAHALDAEQDRRAGRVPDATRKRIA